MDKLFGNLPLRPVQASSYAASVDHLFYYLLAVSGFFALLVVFLILLFAIKYRRKSDEVPPQIKSNLLLELTWIVIPLLLSLTMYVWGSAVYIRMYQPPEHAINIYVVARQWMWKFQHTTGQKEIDQLHVPLGIPVQLTMASQDVIHSFYVPAFRMKADAVPGAIRTAWFEPTRVGTYDLFCAEYCGNNHAGMHGQIIVMRPRDFENWLQGGSEMGSLAAQGHKVFLDLACHTCHKPDGSGRAPVLENLFGKQVTTNTGQTLIADENYIRESILNPMAKIAQGYQPIMPTYTGQVSEEELLQLVEYIKSLSRTPGQREIRPPQPQRGPQTQETTSAQKENQQ
jgi:cytochrome c oxidase subunit 2